MRLEQGNNPTSGDALDGETIRQTRGPIEQKQYRSQTELGESAVRGGVFGGLAFWEQGALGFA